MEGSDLSFLGAGPQAKGFLCVFCKEPYSVPVGDFDKFKDHISDVHNMHNEFEILLAVQFLNSEENDEIIERNKSKLDKSAMEIGPVLQNKICIFCKEKTSITDKIINKHMELCHKLYFGYKIIAAVNLLTELEKERILRRVRNKAEEKDQFKPKSIWKFSNKWPCKFCGRIFKTELSHTAHISFRCNLCGKCFNKLEGLKAHTLKIKNSPHISCLKPSYTCEKCGKGFQNQTILENHMKNKCFRPVLKCEDCQKLFISLLIFKQHKKRRRTCKRQDTQCANCMEWFPFPSYVMKHKIADDCQSIIKCEKCGASFKENRYKMHMRKAKNCQLNNEVKTQTNLKCKICLKRFRNEKCLQIHNNTKKRRCQQRIECSKCGRKIKEGQYEHHMSKSCILEQCEKCGGKFSAFLLKHHLEKTTSCAEVTCVICENKYRAFSKFNIHLEKVHEMKPTHKSGTYLAKVNGVHILCGHCNETFQSTDLMITHAETHIEKGQFKCSKCEKLFINITYMARHEKAHAPEDMKCEFCNKEFISKVSLASHRHLMHMQRFKCNVCGKQYLQEQKFREHIERYHDGVGFSINERKMDIKRNYDEDESNLNIKS